MVTIAFQARGPAGRIFMKFRASLLSAAFALFAGAAFALFVGKAFDHYDMARDGIADVTYVSPGYQPGRFPIIDAGNLPFMVSNAKEGTGALDEWYRKYAEKEMKDVKYCFAFLHDPGTFHSKTKKIVVP